MRFVGVRIQLFMLGTFYLSAILPRFRETALRFDNIIFSINN